MFDLCLTKEEEDEPRAAPKSSTAELRPLALVLIPSQGIESRQWASLES